MLYAGKMWRLQLSIASEAETLIGEKYFWVSSSVEKYHVCKEVFMIHWAKSTGYLKEGRKMAEKME